MEIGITTKDKFYDMKGCRIENNKLNYLKESGTVIIGIHDDFTYEDIAI